MNKLMPSLAIVAIVLPSVAGSLSVARIELPDGLAAEPERITFEGFGGRNKGSYLAAEFSGDFTRGESRLALLNEAYVSNKGKSSYTLTDPLSTDVLSAECEMKKKTVNVDIVTLDPKKMSYQCDFRANEELLGARLVLGQPKAEGFKAKFLAMDIRRGEANIFDTYLVIESIHKYQDSKFQSSAPIGYALLYDGVAVAALELTDVNPTLLIDTGISYGLRRSVMATALALAVLRDPANSALED